VLGSLAGLAAQRGTPGPSIEVFKTASCGCCLKWVDYMKANGFTVRATNVDDIAAVKASYHVPDEAQSCHTAVVGGYAIEGHVPAADVRRVLKERPAVAGIAVAGMPVGSPGMEVEGVTPQAFNTVSFDKQGTVRVFQRH
jgi:hypothetical protein